MRTRAAERCWHDGTDLGARDRRGHGAVGARDRPGLASSHRARSSGRTQVTSVGSEAEAVAIGDVTSDGIADVVLTTGYANTPADFGLFVFAGLADGTLAAPVSVRDRGRLRPRPETVDIGDVNGDGRPDVVVGLSGLGSSCSRRPPTARWPPRSSSRASTATRSRSVTSTSRAGPRSPGSGGGPITVTIFSDTGAGLAVAATYRPGTMVGTTSRRATSPATGATTSSSCPVRAWSNVSVLPALADGTFGAAAEYSVGGNELTHGIGVGDVTGDGRNDVVASYGGNSPTGRLATFAQSPAGTLIAPPVSDESYDIPGAVEVSDVDRMDGPMPSWSTTAGCGSACTAARRAVSSLPRTCIRAARERWQSARPCRR